MTQSSTASRRRRLFWGVIFFGWLISISGVLGNSGLIQAYKLSKARRDLSLRIKSLENEKKKLLVELSSMEQDSYKQELTIRNVLGFVRENELVFEFHNN